MKMEISSGPNITPMKPNRDSPMTTPNIVMRGWVSAIFFWRIKRMRLSILVTINLQLK